MKHVVLLFVFFISSVTGSDYYKHQMNLVKYLTDDSRYSPFQIPLQNLSHTLPIDVTISIGNYVEVHEESQSVYVDLWIKFLWDDFLMTWNSSDYGNIDSLRLDIFQIWHPKIKINFGTDHDSVLTDGKTQVGVSDNGSVDINLIYSTSVRCFLDVARFPFDKQSCQLYIIPLNAYISEINFRNVTTEVKDIGEGQWDILSHGYKLQERSNIAVLAFEFVIKRRPSYYVMYVMLPIMATSLLNPVVFLIPADSGEKVSTAITILLSYSVFLGVISEVLAKTSNSISMLSIYIVGSQLLSGLYVLLCVVIVRRNNKLDTNVISCACLCPSKNAIDDDTQSTYSSNEPAKLKAERYNAGKIDRICARVAFGLTLTATIALSIYMLLGK